LFETKAQARDEAKQGRIDRKGKNLYKASIIIGIA
jgi:hypothetical protein